MLDKFFDLNNFYPEITPLGVRDLKALSEIVFNKHFYYVTISNKEDFLQQAVLKAITLLPQFDPKYGSSLKSYCYTGMRNEMTKLAYHLSKTTSLDDDILQNLNPVGMDISSPVIDIPQGIPLEVSDNLLYYGIRSNPQSNNPILHKELEPYVSHLIYRYVKSMIKISTK